MRFPAITIVIATFNSEKTLGKVLDSLKKQTYPKEKTKIVIVDGGSKDKTLEIARGYRCEVISNPRTEPVYGKFIAFKKVKSQYIIYIDADEVVENKNSIALKIEAFRKHSMVKAVVGSGYKNPKGYPFINQYINEFGDPFTFFTYRLSKDTRFFINSMRSRYEVISRSKNYEIFDLSKALSLPIIELVAGGSGFDATFLKNEFPKTIQRYEFLPHFFYLIYQKYPYLAVVKNDSLIHHSVSSVKQFLSKISWRVKNNVYFTSTMGKAGFLGREEYQPRWFRLKKYLFIPYSFLLIFPLFDSLYLVITRKNLSYLLHLPLCIYTALLIIFHFLLSKIGHIEPLKSYDEIKTIN